jgi:hypothetical protein
MVHVIVLRFVKLMQRFIPYTPALGNPNIHCVIHHRLWKDLHVIYLSCKKLKKMQDLNFNNIPLGSLLC